MEFFVDRVFLQSDIDKKLLVIGQYENCKFNHCDLEQYDFRGFTFIDCVFRGCNLSSVNLHGCSFQSTKIVDCKMLGVDFTQCNTMNLSIEFKGSTLNHSIFYAMDLSKWSFDKCSMISCDFGSAKLKGCSLQGSNLDRAIFEQTDISKANFTEAINYSINPQNNYIKGAIFSAPEVLRLLASYDLMIK